MSSFLHRLAERAMGRASVVQPLVLPRYASPELGPPTAPMDEEDAGVGESAAPALGIGPRIQRAPAGTARQGAVTGSTAAVPEATSLGAAPHGAPGAPSTGSKGERGAPRIDAGDPTARRARAAGDPLAFEVAGESLTGMDAGASSGRAGADELLMGASAGESLAGTGTGAVGSLAGARASFTDAGAGSPAGAGRSRAGAGAGSFAEAGAAFPDVGAGTLASRGTAAPFAGPARSPSAPEPRSESLLLPELEAPEPLAPEARAPNPPSQATTSPGEPTIRITIGRVDVRAAPPPASPRAPAPERKPALSLEDYLASRQRRSR